MSRFLLDTDILIDVLRGEELSISFVKNLENINISFFTILELLQGCKDKVSLNKISDRLEGLDIYYATEMSQKIAWRIYKTYKLKFGIGFVDSLIAGIALENNFILVTKNLRHFKVVEGLRVSTLEGKS